MASSFYFTKFIYFVTCLVDRYATTDQEVSGSISGSNQKVFFSIVNRRNS